MAKDLRKCLGKAWGRLHCWKTNLSNAITLSKSEDTPDLVERDHALNLANGLVERWRLTTTKKIVTSPDETVKQFEA